MLSFWLKVSNWNMFSQFLSIKINKKVSFPICILLEFLFPHPLVGTIICLFLKILVKLWKFAQKNTTDYKENVGTIHWKCHSFCNEILENSSIEFAIRNINTKGTINATSRITPIDQVEVLNLCTCTLFKSEF